VTRLSAAAADVRARLEAESGSLVQERNARAQSDSLIGTLTQQLADAGIAASDLEANLSARLAEMTERVASLEAELATQSTTRSKVQPG
jgi:hypothetical protein